MWCRRLWCRRAWVAALAIALCGSVEGAGRIKLALPASLEHQAEHISAALALSDEQQDALGWMLSHYAERVRPLGIRVMELEAQSVAVADLDSEDPQYATAFGELMREHEQVRRSFEVADAELFQLVSTVLADEQIPDLELFRLERTWTLAMTLAPGFGPCELRADILQLYHDHLERQGLSRRTGSSMALEFLASAAPVAERVLSEYIEVAVKDRELFRSAIEARDSVERAAALGRREKVRSNLFRSAGRLAEVSHKFADRLFAQCCSDAAECELRTQYETRCFPGVYPDRGAVPAQLPRILKDSGGYASSQQREAVEAIVEEHRFKYDRACKKLEDAENAWTALLYSGQPVRIGDREAYERQTALLRRERAMLNSSTLKRVLSVLDGE